MWQAAAIIAVCLWAQPHKYDKDQQLVIAAFELDVANVRTLLADAANPNARLAFTTVTFLPTNGRSLILTSVPTNGRRSWRSPTATAAPQPETRAENTTEGLEAARNKLNSVDPKLIRERDGRRIEIAKILIAAGADLDADDGYGARRCRPRFVNTSSHSRCSDRIGCRSQHEDSRLYRWVRQHHTATPCGRSTSGLGRDDRARRRSQCKGFRRGHSFALGNFVA